VITAGTASSANAHANPLRVWPRQARTPATASGPISAPVWSIASAMANALPAPMSAAANDVSVDFAGDRIALPSRSTPTSTATIGQLAASASSGTAMRLVAYPAIVSAQ